MKTLFTLAISCFLILQSFAQPQIRASVAPGSAPNRLKILMMSDVNQLATDGPLSSLTFNVGIVATGVPIPPTLTIIALPTFPGPASQWSVSAPFVEGTYWNYNIFLLPPVSPVSTANVPYGVIEVEFGGFPLLNASAGLVSLINGGSNSQSYFYCNGPVYSNGLSQLYYLPSPGVITTNSDSYDINGINGNGVSSALLASVVLPVKFTGFTAIKKDNSAVLNWQVESETALTDRYEVERSLNGIDFKTISTIAPKNNGRSANSYTSTDADLSAIHSGVIYYRIKQTDKDGQFVYTEIKSVRLDSKGFSASVYPNPVQRQANLSIDLVENSPVTITVNDANGKVVKNVQMQGLKGVNKKEIDMSSLSRGNYLLRVQTATETKTLNIVKGNN